MCLLNQKLKTGLVSFDFGCEIFFGTISLLQHAYVFQAELRHLSPVGSVAVHGSGVFGCWEHHIGNLKSERLELHFIA